MENGPIKQELKVGSHSDSGSGEVVCGITYLLVAYVKMLTKFLGWLGYGTWKNG